MPTTAIAIWSRSVRCTMYASRIPHALQLINAITNDSSSPHGQPFETLEKCTDTEQKEKQ